MNIDINKTVSYAVNKVRVRNVLINKIKDKFIFSVPYEWLDVNENVVRNGTNLYKQDQIESAMGEQKPVLDALVDGFGNIFAMKETPRSLLFSLTDDQVSAVLSFVETIDDKPKASILKLNQTQIEEKLNLAGSSIAVLRNVVTGFTSQIFAND